MDNHVEEKNVSQDSYDETDENGVENFLTLALNLIKRADALFPEIEEEGGHEQYKAEGSKRPFIIAIERIGERGGETHRAQAQKHKNDR